MYAVAERHLFCFVASLLLSLYIVPIIIRAATRLGILDVPDGKIKNHKTPTPYLGGVAVYLAFIIPLALAYPFENQVLWLLLGTTLLLFVGLVDDLKVLKAGQKFLGQVIAVLCFLKGGFSLKAVFFSSMINLSISAFWMLSVINAFNLVDVMDGLSSSIALIAGCSFFLIALALREYLVSLLIASFIGALAGFFWYNKPPAKIYLGDAGSLFIGGFLAAIPMLIPWSSQSWDSYYAPAVVLGIPLLEVFCLVVIRTWLGILPYHGSPHHFAIYLQKKGWSKNKVLIFTAVMGIILSLGASAFLFGFLSWWTLFGLGILFFITWCFIIF
jgi:UDP-GlcNAc:undecaprenyl-phosphate GlcNAc-1-phosphate transferase